MTTSATSRNRPKAASFQRAKLNQPSAASPRTSRASKYGSASRVICRITGMKRDAVNDQPEDRDRQRQGERRLRSVR